jgi:GTPase Era involved in 16S rRNA processing
MARFLVREVEKIVDRERSKPFVVSVMGQTGVGKSSLINALFGANLRTDPVRPCTKDIERVTSIGKSGHELWFYDLPGLGEAGQVDGTYLAEYRKKLLESDVVIWAIHSDNRSVAFDLAALEQLLGDNEEERVQLMSKITFVLTKVDLLTPPPWILATDGDHGVFAPSRGTTSLLEEKRSYYEEAFIRPYGNLMTSQTYNDSGFAETDAGLTFDQYAVYYRGLLEKATVVGLKQRYPRHAAIFDRLHDNYKVIPCSSLFRYNLSQLMLVVVNKLGTNAISRFGQFTSDTLNRVPVTEARNYCNLVVYDTRSNQLTFDLRQRM